MSRTYAEQLRDLIGCPNVPCDVVLGASNALDRQASEIEQLRNEVVDYHCDIRLLLSQIDYLQEASGECLEPEDAAFVHQVRSKIEATLPVKEKG